MKRSDYALIDGARFYYELAGEGTPLVLVHAGICDSRMWDEQFDELARTNSLLRYDRRGFGRTEAPTEAFSHHQDLFKLLTHLGIERACLVGCSQGGKTIIDFTLEHPEMTLALVPVASALSGFEYTGDSPTDRREIELAEEAGDLERVNELEVQLWLDGPRSAPGRIQGKVRELVREMNRVALEKGGEAGRETPLVPPAFGRLGEIAQPTLIIIGDLDTNETISAADHLAKHIPGARKVVMEGTAHLPNMEQPAEFNRHLLSFLSSVG